MATSIQVLSMLFPNGGYVQNGDTFEGIQFIECQPITKAEYTAGFAEFDKLELDQAEAAATQKAALLARLGITADEAKLLIG